MTLFQPNPVEPGDIHEATRLARRSAAVWFGGCVLLPLALGGLFGSGSGEMAMLGGFYWLIGVVIACAFATAISIRLALRALSLDPSAGTAKIALGLNALSILYVVFVIPIVILV